MYAVHGSSRLVKCGLFDVKRSRYIDKLLPCPQSILTLKWFHMNGRVDHANLVRACRREECVYKQKVNKYK